MTPTPHLSKEGTNDIAASKFSGMAPDIFRFDSETNKYLGMLKYHEKEAQLINYSEFKKGNNNKPVEVFWGGKDADRPMACLFTTKYNEKVLMDDTMGCPTTGMVYFFPFFMMTNCN